MSRPGYVNIKGKEYKTVAGRVNEFRQVFSIEEGWGVLTSIIECNADDIMFRADIVDPQGRVVATGFAEETRTSYGINATSALENCETSAIGRALSAAGFAGDQYASAEEVKTAIAQQNDHASWRNGEQERFNSVIGKWGWTYDTLCEYLQEAGSRRPYPAKWTQEKRNELLHKLEARAKAQE